MKNKRKQITEFFVSKQRVITKLLTDSLILNIIVFVIIFLFYLYIALVSEPTVDDLTYMDLDLDSFFDGLSYCLHYGNGRLLGNLFGVYLSRIYIFQIIVKTMFPCLIIILVSRLCDFKYKFTYFLQTIMLIILPAEIFSQVISWTSGFANYIIPVLIMLVNLNLFKYANEENVNRYKYIFFFTGLIGQLFVEHCTVINIAISFVLMIYLKREKNFKVKIIYPWFISSVIGAGIMYIIPKIFSSDGFVESYRISPTIIDENGGVFVWNILRLIPREFFQFKILFTIILILLILKYILNLNYKRITESVRINMKKTESFNLKKFGLHMICLLFFCICIVLVEIYSIISNNWKYEYVKWIPMIIIVALIIYFEKSNKKVMIMLALAFVCIAPLIFVYRGITPRCLYNMYICLCVATSFFADDVINDLKNNGFIQEKYTKLLNRFIPHNIQ